MQRNEEKVQEKTQVQQFNIPMSNTILEPYKLATIYQFLSKDNKLNKISILSIGVLKSVFY